MRSPLLVLVRWRGDIVATYDAVPAAVPLVSEQDGVTVEVYDVAAERAGLSLRRGIDWRIVAGVAASFALHAGVVLTVFLLLTLKDRIVAIVGDEPARNEQSAVVEDPVLRIAANENPVAKPEEERPPQPADPIARPEPPRVEHKPVAAVAAHGSSGHDAVSTSRTVCSPPKGLAANTGPTCTRSVVLSSISTRTSCFVDTVAHAGDKGTLTYPCDGDGEATLTFGNRSFSGASLGGGNVNVCTGTEYPWSDGCSWTSAQRVTGSVASGTLRFTYGEAPKAGEHNCAGACTASATVRIEGESWR